MNAHCNFWYLVKELRFTVKLSGTNLLVNIQFLSVSLSLHAMFPSVNDRALYFLLPYCLLNRKEYRFQVQVSGIRNTEGRREMEEF